MKSKFEFTGLENYIEVLQKAGKDIDLVSRDALKDVGHLLKSAMESRVPIDTGNLRDHIKIFTPSREGHYNYIVVGIIHDIGFTDAETARYANAVEFGSVTAEAHPFVRPAIRSKRTAVNNLIRDRLRSAELID